MRSTPGILAKLVVAAVMVVITSGKSAAPSAAASAAPPAFASIGPLTFSADGTLFAADTEEATIHAVDLGVTATGGAPGVKSIAALDQQVAALLGTGVRDLSITDLAVHPKTHNAYVSVMRGQGVGATPVLLRIDGAGTIDIVDFAKLTSTKVALPNPPSAAATSGFGRPSRGQSITDMAYMDGRLYVAGLSNEEFSSKLRSIAYPFTAADNGTSVEIFHGSHGQFETRSPVYTFIPYKIGNEPNLIAGYLCTPLVKFPVSSLKPGAKVMGTTIAELGAGNRPIDMILYRKDGREFLLMSNTDRGVMKIPTDRFATAPGITTPISDKAGIAYETVASMKGIEQLDLLDEGHSLVIARSSGGALSLDALPLP
jgi:hypothetical protein